MNRLTQAFHHWARAHNLPSLDPSTLSTIVDFHFDLHLPHTQQYFLHAHVQQALTTLEPLVRHCEDHADSRLMLYCPAVYGKVLDATFTLLPCESPPLRSINGNEKASSADSAVAIHGP